MAPRRKSKGGLREAAMNIAIELSLRILGQSTPQCNLAGVLQVAGRLPGLGDMPGFSPALIDQAMLIPEKAVEDALIRLGWGAPASYNSICFSPSSRRNQSPYPLFPCLTILPCVNLTSAVPA
jgi:hypothetical protein